MPTTGTTTTPHDCAAYDCTPLRCSAYTPTMGESGFGGPITLETWAWNTLYPSVIDAGLDMTAVLAAVVRHWKHLA